MYVCMYRCFFRDILTTATDFSGPLTLKLLVEKENKNPNAKLNE